MNIETIEDIIEDLADKFDIYGQCSCITDEGFQNPPSGNCRKTLICCRVNFAVTIKDRIYKAIENEKILNQI